MHTFIKPTNTSFFQYHLDFYIESKRDVVTALVSLVMTKYFQLQFCVKETERIFLTRVYDFIKVRRAV